MGAQDFVPVDVTVGSIYQGYVEDGRDFTFGSPSQWAGGTGACDMQ